MVSLAGWAVGIQLDPDSLIPMIHCQDLKKILRPRGLVLWLKSDQPDPATTQPVFGASTVCQSTPGSAPSTVSGILSQQSLPHNLDTDVPVLLPRGSICVDGNHALHPFFGNHFDAGPVQLAPIVHAFNYRVAVLRDDGTDCLCLSSDRTGAYIHELSIDQSPRDSVVSSLLSLLDMATGEALLRGKKTPGDSSALVSTESLSV